MLLVLLDVRENVCLLDRCQQLAASSELLDGRLLLVVMMVMVVRLEWEEEEKELVDWRIEWSVGLIGNIIGKSRLMMVHVIRGVVISLGDGQAAAEVKEC